MDATDALKIDLRALSTNVQQFRAVLDDAFFSSLDQQEIAKGRVEADITVQRTSEETFDVVCRLRGEVEVPCTYCLEPMTLPIEAEDTLKVRFGESEEDDGETLTVLWRKGLLDLSWPLYEMTALAVPIRHVHPECDSEDDNDNENEN